jgi:hypothetical protein
MAQQQDIYGYVWDTQDRACIEEEGWVDLKARVTCIWVPTIEMVLRSVKYPDRPARNSLTMQGAFERYEKSPGWITLCSEEVRDLVQQRLSDLRRIQETTDENDNAYWSARSEAEGLEDWQQRLYDYDGLMDDMD